LVVPGALDVSLGGQQASVEVVDRRGRIVARSLSLGGRVLPVDPLLRDVIASGRGRFAAATLGGQTLRVYAAPLADSGGAAAGGAVAVATTTSEIGATLASVHVFVLATALVAAVAAAAVLALLMRRALAPLGRLTTAAAEIERTGDTRRRLPEPETDDEIGRLAATLNSMLGALERARESERRFLADASHELRTPLTALAGNVDYLARYGASDELVADLQADARRMTRLAEDLLALSREEAAADAAGEVRLDELAREAGGDRVMVDGPVAVTGDRPALERALANLVENARLHGRGLVTVEARRSGDVAVLTVGDEGPGVAPDDREAVFERFRRGNGGGPGSGLGLAIVRATAERHGGRVFADGAQFTMELPALRDVSESATRTEGEQAKGAT
jgi:signal transduction histidine kinase